MNPCIEFCWNRYKKQYSPECDIKCEYAKVALEYKELRRSIKHGKWLVNKEDGYVSIAPCSICGAVNDIDFKFCPDCGARMDIKD